MLIDINCDVGEGMGNEEALMPFINSANIACGYHAGDEDTMKHIVQLCLQHQVNIGAHPSFLDRENFGRTAMQLSPAAIQALIAEQLNIMKAITDLYGAKLYHVKPHGALYNMAAKDAVIAKAIAQAVKDFDPSLVYYGLSGSVMITEAKKLGLATANEVFADRTYQNDGTLTPRSQPNALLNSEEEVIAQVIRFLKEKKVKTLTGEEIYIESDTICLHGDGAHAVELARAINQRIDEE